MTRKTHKKHNDLRNRFKCSCGKGYMEEHYYKNHIKNCEYERRPMNKKGQSQVLFSIMVACMIFFVGMIAVNFIKDDVTTSRTQNSCSSPITDGNKLTCSIIDFVVPYFFVFILSVMGGLITDKFLQ